MNKIIFLVLSIIFTLAFTACGSDSKPTSTSDTAAPVFTSSNTASVNENQTSAIILVATDTSSVTYSISGGDSDSFNIDSSTGVVTFKTAPDFETNQNYSFTAKATDTSGNSATQSIAITILDEDNGTAKYTINGEIVIAARVEINMNQEDCSSLQVNIHNDSVEPRELVQFTTNFHTKSDFDAAFVNNQITLNSNDLQMGVEQNNNYIVLSSTDFNVTFTKNTDATYNIVTNNSFSNNDVVISTIEAMNVQFDTYNGDGSSNDCNEDDYTYTVEILPFPLATAPVGGTIAFTAIVKNNLGIEIDPQPIFTWSSDNEIATVVSTDSQSAVVTISEYPYGTCATIFATTEDGKYSTTSHVALSGSTSEFPCPSE